MPETEALTIQAEARPKIKAFTAWDRDEVEAYQFPRRDRAEALLRLETASRPARGVKTEATSHIHIIPRTDVVLKRSGGSLELRLNRSGIFKHNFIHIMLKCLPTRPRRLLPRPRPRPRPSVSRPRPRPRRSVSRPRWDRGVWNFNRGKTEPRHYCASRQDRGHIPGSVQWQWELQMSKRQTQIGWQKSDNCNSTADKKHVRINWHKNWWL